MSKTDFLSFLVPPLPYFIEGNFTTYQKGIGTRIGIIWVILT